MEEIQLDPAPVLIARDVSRIVAREIALYDPVTEALKASRNGSQANAIWYENNLRAFQEALIDPQEVTVHFAGGFEQLCWSVTRTDGRYRVIYIPRAGYFALVMESAIGPLDMAVHGKALDVFASI